MEKRSKAILLLACLTLALLLPLANARPVAATPPMPIAPLVVGGKGIITTSIMVAGATSGAAGIVGIMSTVTKPPQIPSSVAYGMQLRGITTLPPTSPSTSTRMPFGCSGPGKLYACQPLGDITRVSSVSWDKQGAMKKSDKDVERVISKEHIGKSHPYPGYDVYYIDKKEPFGCSGPGTRTACVAEMHGLTETDIKALKDSWNKRGIKYKDYSKKP